MWNVHLETLLDLAPLQPPTAVHVSFISETNWWNSLIIRKKNAILISSPRQFQIIPNLSPTSSRNKRRAVPVWKRQRGKSACLWVESLICTEHTTKRQVLVYHYEIIGGIWLPSFFSLTMAHYASAVRPISKWPTLFPRNNVIHLTETKSGSVGTGARSEEREKKKERQRKDMEFSFSWNIVGVGLKKAQRQCARLW